MGCGGSEVDSEPAEGDLTGLPEQEYLAQDQAYWAEYLKIENPPAVEVIRYVDSDESQQVYRECMGEQGFPTDSEGAIDVPIEQQEHFMLSQFTCYVRYPLKQEYAKPDGSEQVSIQYDWTTQFVIPCLEEMGQIIPEPPSRTEFIDQWASAPYFPFQHVVVSNAHFNEELDALENKCLQSAPGAVRWGELTIEEWVAQRGLK